MTPKEKAIDLVNKYYNEIKYMERAKDCALIAVDEIIYYLEIVLGTDKKDFEYWHDVRTEIANL